MTLRAVAADSFFLLGLPNLFVPEGHEEGAMDHGMNSALSHIRFWRKADREPPQGERETIT